MFADGWSSNILLKSRIWFLQNVISLCVIKMRVLSFANYEKICIKPFQPKTVNNTSELELLEV